MQRGALDRPANLDDRQMPLVGESTHDEFESCPMASPHRDPWRCATRSARPERTRLESRLLIPWWRARVGLERAPTEGLVRAVLVEPRRVGSELGLHLDQAESTGEHLKKRQRKSWGCGHRSKTRLLAASPPPSSHLRARAGVPNSRSAAPGACDAWRDGRALAWQPRRGGPAGPRRLSPPSETRWTPTRG